MSGRIVSLLPFVVAVAVAAASAGGASDRSQLIASAGLTSVEAEQLTLNEIAAHFFNRSSDGDNQQSVGTFGHDSVTVVMARGRGTLGTDPR